MLRPLAILAATILPALAARAEPPPSQPREVYEIRREANSSSRTSGEMGGSGTTHDVDVLVERVIAVRDDGVELEYDLPADATADDRASDWHFPVRVLRPPHGPLQLLNGPELQARLETWLREAGIPREACGHWIFTWNAFQIDCDPQSAIPAIEQFTLWPDELRDGASWQQPGSRAPVALREEGRASGHTAFVARMEVDPEAVRRDRVHTDIVVAEIMHRPLTPEAARQAHAAEQISGTIVTTFEIDAARNLRRRTTVTELEVRGGAEGAEHRTVTETVERRLTTLVPPNRAPAAGHR